ncbi:MAG: hypothetical protein NC411_01330 [Bacteroides sp.]|nr:hypothetical protein [Bacteroides sp.]
MRYALRNQDKIANSYSKEYLNQHLLASLNQFFKVVDEDDLDDYWIINTTEYKYPILRINDLADNNVMLEFAVIDRQLDVFKLAFMGRMKG